MTEESNIRAQNDPSNPVLHCNKDVCHSKIGQWERSVEDCNEALKIRPSYTKALHRRAAKKFLLQMVKTMRKFLMRLLQKRNQEQQDVEQSIYDLVDKIKSSSHGQAMEM